jgi:hypothetical protein
LSEHGEHDPHNRFAPINESLIIDTIRIEAERRQKAQDEKDEQARNRQAAHDRQMLLITLGLFVATLLTGIAALYQAHSSGVSAIAAKNAADAASGTLEILKNSSAQSSGQADQIITNLNRVASSMEGTLKQSRDTFEASARQADNALKATLAQNNAALTATLTQADNAMKQNLTTSQLEMRPYLIVEGKNGQKLLGMPQNPGFVVDMVNVGKSVAKGVRLFFKADKAPAIFTRGGAMFVGDLERVFNEARSGPLLAPEDIAPTGTISTLLTERARVTGFSPADLDNFKAGKIMLIFAGGAVYRDVFSSVEHSTEFCYFLLVNPQTAGVDPAQIIGCPFHNRVE